MHDEGWMAAEGPILGSMALGPPCVFAGLLRTCRSRRAPHPCSAKAAYPAFDLDLKVRTGRGPRNG